MTVYRRKFEETNNRIYYATTDGKFYSISKVTNKKRYLTPHRSGKVIAITVAGGHEVCKNLIAKLFIKGIKKYDIVEQINGDLYDFRVENLKVIPREEYIMDTVVKYQKGRSKMLRGDK